MRCTPARAIDCGSAMRRDACTAQAQASSSRSTAPFRGAPAPSAARRQSPPFCRFTVSLQAERPCRYNGRLAICPSTSTGTRLVLSLSGATADTSYSTMPRIALTSGALAARCGARSRQRIARSRQVPSRPEQTQPCLRSRPNVRAACSSRMPKLTAAARSCFALATHCRSSPCSRKSQACARLARTGPASKSTSRHPATRSQDRRRTSHHPASSYFRRLQTPTAHAPSSSAYAHRHPISDCSWRRAAWPAGPCTPRSPSRHSQATARPSTRSVKQRI